MCIVRRETYFSRETYYLKSVKLGYHFIYMNFQKVYILPIVVPFPPRLLPFSRCRKYKNICLKILFKNPTL